jgi:IS605 OrfB family transposase
VLRELSAPFVVLGPSGVAIRTRLKGLTAGDEEVLRLVGAHLGSLASRDLKQRCAEGLEHSTDTWARRKRALSGESSSRWAGSITKATHDQWALSRRAQLAHIQGLEAGVRVIAHRLSLPVGEKGTKRAPGGYRTKQEWFAKTRRLRVLEDRLAAERADRAAGRVRVVRGGKQLARNHNHLDQAQLTETAWRQRWEAARWFLQADGESRSRIWRTPGTAGTSSPAASPSATASWTIPPTRTVPLSQARADGMIGVDTNADHLAAWRLDAHGNPVGAPRRFFFDLDGPAGYRDAQIRHALIRLLHFAKRHGLSIAIEDLDFQADKTREKHGRRKRFRNLISGMPVSRLRSRLASMAAELGITIVAVDPAYTSRWGAQHWQKPLTSNKRATTRHDAAAVAIGRRALGHPIRRRTARPRTHQSDGCGHRTAQAGPGARGREETRPRIPGPRTRSMRAGRGAKAGDQDAQHRSRHPAEHGSRQQDSLPLSL